MKENPSHLVPVNYRLHLIPDMVSFRFYGTVEVLLEARAPTGEMAMNILDITVWRCQVKIDDVFTDCPFLMDPRNETIQFAFPEEMEGDITVRFEFEGHINDKMAGFYRSRYTVDGVEKYIAVTQFEESDARRAFPCMDHPERKATFDVEMVIDEDLVAISNGTLETEISLGDGKKRVTFQQTPRMSTYLLFFGVGEFEILEDEKDPRMRAVTMPGLTRHAQFALDFGRKALKACEDYYGTNYPLPKLDLIAIPDFAFGAMENWGAIAFRENLLLHYPDVTSVAGEERICEVIAHELAHQWFGNLVTPSDWQYLWLNESFATLHAYRVLDQYYPEWQAWSHFTHTETDTALERDSLHETFPIEIPGGEHVVINTSTAPIIYNKGGSILRQIEGYIGTESFQRGLQYYLKEHEYACASSRNLWEAFETVTDKPIARLMKSWIEQPGYPFVIAERSRGKLRLTQKRFTCLPNASNQLWQIPVTITVFDNAGETQQMKVLLKDSAMDIEMMDGIDAYKINSGQTGFYRVLYRDDENLDRLGKRVQDKTLSPEDRWGLQNDIFALVRSGDATMDDYLSFLSFYREEDMYLPLIGIFDNLFKAHHILQNPMKGRIAESGRALLEKVLSDTGYEPVEGEPHTMSSLRDQLIWYGAVFGSQPIISFALEQFDALRQDTSISPDIMRSVMQVGALGGDENTFDWFDQRFRTSVSEHDRMNVLTALGCFSDPALTERTKQYILDTVPDRNKFIPIVSLATNPNAAPDMWDWYVDNLSSLEQWHPIIYERTIAAIVSLCCIDQAETVKAFFSTYLGEHPKVKDVIRLSLEKLEINVLMRAG